MSLHNPIGVTRRAALAAVTALAALITLAATPALAAEAPARILVPFPPGGAADLMARILAEKLKDDLGRQVLVENKPGAGTRLAAETLKQAAPDGATVLMTSVEPLLIAPMVYRSLRFNPSTDFMPISEVASFEFALVVSGNSPYTTLAQYLQAVKADRSLALIGITSPGTTAHFFAYDFSATTKIDAQLVPFQGGPALVTNVVGGQVPAVIDATTVFAEHHRGKKLRILAVSSAKRLSDLPEVPTFAESGFPSLVGGGTYMLLAPKGTPDAQIQKWNQALRKALAVPDVRAKLEKVGYEVSHGSSPEQAAARMRAISERLAPVVKASGFKGD